MTLDREDIEAVAREVAELLAESRVGAENETPRRFVDAATLARLLGISRATVYARADELGAIRVGRGKRARLRFDPARSLGAPSSNGNGAAGTGSRRRPKARKSAQGAAPNLLPIRGGRSRLPGRLRS